MKVKILPSETYDNNAPKEISALIFALISLVIFLINRGIEIIPHQAFWIVALIYRTIAAIWVYNIMDRLNRDKGWSAIAAFIFPILVLIIVGVVKKKNIRFEIDRSYSEDEQIAEIRQYADQFVKKGKFTEAAFVYQYITSKLPFTETDKETYNELLSKSKIPVPDFKVVDK